MRLAGELAFTALYSGVRWRSTGVISRFHSLTSFGVALTVVGANACLRQLLPISLSSGSYESATEDGVVVIIIGS